MAKQWYLFQFGFAPQTIFDPHSLMLFSMQDSPKSNTKSHIQQYSHILWNTSQTFLSKLTIKKIHNRPKGIEVKPTPHIISHTHTSIIYLFARFLVNIAVDRLTDWLADWLAPVNIQKSQRVSCKTQITFRRHFFCRHVESIFQSA